MNPRRAQHIADVVPRLSGTLLAGIARHRQQQRLQLALQACTIAGDLRLLYLHDATATAEGKEAAREIGALVTEALADARDVAWHAGERGPRTERLSGDVRRSAGRRRCNPDPSR